MQLSNAVLLKTNSLFKKKAERDSLEDHSYCSFLTNLKDTTVLYKISKLCTTISLFDIQRAM
jgi:hypothetical protein